MDNIDSVPETEESAEEIEVAAPETDAPEEIDVGKELSGLSSEFSHLKDASPEGSVNTERYAELRALGLSPKEAFLATEKREARHTDGLSHLGGSFPKIARTPTSGISTSQMKTARELFGDLSDDEIRSLYKRVTQ